MSLESDYHARHALQSLSELYRSQRGVDFTIKCNDRRFGCHRHYLAQCAGWFSALFNGERYMENAENSVDVSETGFDPAIVEAVIQSCYGISVSFETHGYNIHEVENAATPHAHCFTAGHYFQLDHFADAAARQFRELLGLNDALEFDMGILRYVYQKTLPPGQEPRDGEEAEAKAWDFYHQNAVNIFEVAPIVFSGTPEDARELRDVVIELILFSYDEFVLNNPNIRITLAAAPGLAIDLLMRTAEFQTAASRMDTEWKCRHCGLQFVLCAAAAGIEDVHTSKKALTCPACRETCTSRRPWGPTVLTGYE
ncbi:MAG: hypothetical protein Q9162_001455 [Coniocarpon cinnabarinum]